MLAHYVRILGIQRVFLSLVTLSLVILAFFSAGEAAYEGWRSIPTVVAPTLVPIMFFVLFLDILMSAIYSADQSDEVRRRYRFIIRNNLAWVVVLVASWWNFYADILYLD